MNRKKIVLLTRLCSKYQQYQQCMTIEHYKTVTQYVTQMLVLSLRCKGCHSESLAFIHVNC